ncbi:MAG: hypothetical protein HY397_02775 [Candidatus Doudnabacteria bacterium]|nr:hypothetical protein [Candidatus Doudnabacteria bacterium]
MTKSLDFLPAVALLVGSVVGAGFLGIPYVVARIGFPLGLLLILGLGLLMMVQYLAIAEVTLRTKGKHQVAGYVERYLGAKWKKFAYAVVVLESYGVLLAFMVGEGQVLSALFGGSPFLFSYLFFAVVALIIFFGIRLVERVDLLLTTAVSLVILGLAFASWSSLSFDNFLKVDFTEFFPAYGVVLFAFLGASAIPEMRLALAGREKRFSRSVVIGTFIPIALYTLFTIAVLGVTGLETTPIATIGLGRHLGGAVMLFGNLLAVITMTTSFLGIALGLRETFQYDLRLNKNESWILTCAVPVILFSFGIHNFIGIIGFVGAILGGFLGILLVFTAHRAEQLGDRKPEFVLPHKVFFGSLLALVFAIGIVSTLWGLLGPRLV